jgi:hypothetical protein
VVDLIECWDQRRRRSVIHCTRREEDEEEHEQEQKEKRREEKKCDAKAEEGWSRRKVRKETKGDTKHGTL